MTTIDPRTSALGSDRWLTDSRVYNLLWLGRWIERAQGVARALLWAAGRDDHDGGMDEAANMAAAVRGISIATGETALEALMTRDGSASLRGCLAAARYNATHVAPVETLRVIGAAIQRLDEVETVPDTAEEVAALMRNSLDLLDELHSTIEETWFHSEALSEEEVFRRFVQQQ